MLSKGLHYETMALNYLKSKGLRVLARNYRNRMGEIDLIMRENESIVFVEVRYRKHDKHGSASESVTSRKQAKIIKCASQFLSEKRLWQNPVRFDVIAICEQINSKKAQIEWIESAFLLNE